MEQNKNSLYEKIKKYVEPVLKTILTFLILRIVYVLTFQINYKLLPIEIEKINEIILIYENNIKELDEIKKTSEKLDLYKNIANI